MFSDQLCTNFEKKKTQSLIMTCNYNLQSTLCTEELAEKCVLYAITHSFYILITEI